jgi:hypothetical protein
MLFRVGLEPATSVDITRLNKKSGISEKAEPFLHDLSYILQFIWNINFLGTYGNTLTTLGTECRIAIWIL